MVLSSLEKSKNLSVASCYCKAEVLAAIESVSVARMLQAEASLTELFDVHLDLRSEGFA